MDTEGSQSSLSSGTDNSPHDPCKMFIGGLSWQTTQEGLKEYFCKFGEVKECMVMRDPVTKRSRGFGFVTYTEQAGVEKVLAQNRHELDSKTFVTLVDTPRPARCKVPLQSLPRTLQLHLSYTALCSRSGGKCEALKGPRRIYVSVDLSSEAGNYHRGEMKGLFEY
uniref:RRM domain-containing protein n=1 Tax=Astatotilapia calliptera TaxID=8154 RepID=A0A3P8PHG6_ASTCA